MADIYNWEAVSPFLAKFNPMAKKKLHGMSATSVQLREEDRQYFYHVTTLNNLASILHEGLNPERGGIGGAGTLIAGEKDYQEAQVGNGQNSVQMEQKTHFNEHSHGFVHASEYPEVLTRYIYEYDEMADQGEGKVNGVQNAPVVLRFKKEILESGEEKLYEKDPYEGRKSTDVRAIRTKQPIKWEQLEILTEKGWTPFVGLLKDDKANGKLRLARDVIYDNVSEILVSNTNELKTGVPLKEEEPKVKEEMKTGNEPELTSVTELLQEDGMVEIGSTRKPKSGEKIRNKGIGK